MLDQLRSATQSWIFRTFLGILLLSFVLWEVPSLLRSTNSTDLLSTGKSTISITQYQSAVNDAILRSSLLAGHNLTENEISYLEIRPRILERLSAELVLDETARKLKLNLSEDSIAKFMAKDPLFKDSNNRFNKELFQRYLELTQTSEQDFFTRIDRLAKREQLMAANFAGLQVPSAIYSILSLYEQETRNIDFIRLASSSLAPVADPDEKTLSDWFQQHQNRFRAPEYRQISYLSLSATAMAAKEAFSPEMIAAFYQTHRQNYLQAPEKRIIEILRFKEGSSIPNMSSAKDFDQFVHETKQNPAEIRQGPLERSDLSLLVASEVFSLPQGAVTPILHDISGPIVIKIVAIEPETIKPLADVTEEIRKELIQERAANLLVELRETQKKIENSRFEGASLQEISKEYGLVLQQETLDAMGKRMDGTSASVPAPELLIPTIFQTDVDLDTDPLTLADGYVWYHVDKLIPQRQLSLSEVRSETQQQWKKDKLLTMLNEKAIQIKNQLETGKLATNKVDNSLANIAQQQGLEKKTVAGLKRHNPQKKELTDVDHIFDETTLKAIFSASPNEYSILPIESDEAILLFQVTQRQIPSPESQTFFSDEEQNILSQRLKNDLSLGFIATQAKEHPVQLNKNLYQQLSSSQ